MRLSELAHAGRTPSVPLHVSLADGAGRAELVLERLLRVLPGQRYVGAGTWRGRPVLAKLLVGRSAAKHFQRELQGVRLLAQQGLTTPQLLADGLEEGEGGWLLFELLDPVQSLGEVWSAVADEPALSEAQQQVLGEALAVVAHMHAKGLWQDDLHLDNLLRHAGTLYLIDGAGVRAETPGRPLSRTRVLENLGVFFAQLPKRLEPFLEELSVHYLLANGEHALPLEALQKQVDKVRAWRQRDFLDKVARDCSLFSVERSLRGLSAVWRDEASVLLPILADADTLIDQGHLYKTGGAASVARVDVGDRRLVIKRYNIKSTAHWFKRFWRPSRAWHSWVEGHRLGLLDIATPRPLAVLEQRVLGLRSTAYLVTEFVDGPDLTACFAPYVDDGLPPQAQVQALVALMQQLIHARVSHGDFKGHNLFWHHDRWSLIDLDAMCQHASQLSFAPAFARDRARLLRNWPTSSALHRHLDDVLPRL